MPIRIEITGETADEIVYALRRLGGAVVAANEIDSPKAAFIGVDGRATDKAPDPGTPLTAAMTGATPTTHPPEGQEFTESSTAATVAKRTRRTKAEIEAAKAAEAGDAEQKPLISADPENRIDPGAQALAELAAEDTSETQAQDAADEAAESVAHAEPDAKLSGEHVRGAMGLYADKYGFPAALLDMKTFIGAEKCSDMPDTQEAYAAAIAAIKKAIVENPFGRVKVTG